MTDALRKRLIDRLEHEYPMMISLSPGWADIVDRLDRDLAGIYPDYTLRQVKEKFGGLRYYVGAVPEDKFDAVYDRISAAERESYATCEECGTQNDVTTESSGWATTVCPTCRAELRAERARRDAEMDAKMAACDSR